MEINKADGSSTSVTENIEEQLAVEEHLVTYLQNILKYQIIPMNFMDLRSLIKDAPQKLKLYPFIQEKYPGSEFLSFLQKYSAVFKVNLDQSVTILGPSYCTQTQPDKSDYDEIDGYDKEEYISDPDSD